MGMSMRSRKELTKALVQRYRSSTRGQKSKILDEFCEATGYVRSYAASLLRGYTRNRIFAGGSSAVRVVTTKKHRRANGRPRVYGQDVQQALAQVWRRLGYLCGKRLAPMIRDSVEAIRTDPFLSVSDEVVGMLGHMSPATIDRLLKSEREKLVVRGRSYTGVRGGLWDLIPIRTFGEWKDVSPGHAQMDTVGHDGGFGTGDCAFSLCLTDICLGWTERRGLQNRAARWVIAALDEIRADIPFPIIHMHPDNGSEFINKNLMSYCNGNHIELSRSRPERKNDNCYVEQKNFDTIRKLVGYARYSTPEALETLNELYRVHGLLQNYFLPSQKLIRKTREGSKVRKYYDSPQAPADRLLAHPAISEEIKQHVRARKTSLNPLELGDRVKQLQKQLLELADRIGSPVQQEAVR